ncbi:MAG: RagB/SusD family nutrient uptake outer membrane protein [Bacteroidota bacterium]
MKKIRYIIIFLTIPVGIVLYSCSKSFLEKPALGALSEDVLANKKGVTGLLVGAYAALDGQNVGGGIWESSPDNWIYGSVAGADSHKGSWSGDQPPIDLIGTGKSDPSNGFFNAKWIACYEGIARCNSVLRVVEKATDITDDEKKIFIGEARFLRGHYYSDLKKMFNMVPWIDETTTDLKTPNNVDIWPNIEADFKNAADNLGDIAPAVGRVNKWAATAYLAKTYLYEKKYEDAKNTFTTVINSGKTSQGVAYDLYDRYEDNFDPATKNGKESVFAVQMSAKDGSGGIGNANQGDMLNFPYGDSPFGCCGFYQPTFDLVNSFRTDPTTGLPFVDTYNSVIITNDQNVGSNDPFTPYTGSLDPRLDWTVGRRGLPYNDWGIHPGQKWIRDQGYSGPYAPKKNIFWQKTADQYWDKSSWAPGSAININIIRFGDVLLMAAEAEAQAGSLDIAEDYVNRVRNRAAKPQSALYKYINDADPLAGFSTTPAANYKISPYDPGYFAAQGKDNALKAIYFERKLELGMEGHRFFDLVRWGIAATTLNAYFTFEKQFTADVQSGSFTAGKNEYFPIPIQQMDLSVSGGTATLTQNPGY